MKNNDNILHGILQLPKWIFGISFTIGTLLFLLFCVFKNIEIALCGLIYLITATITNLMVLLIQIAFSFVYKKHQLIILKNTSILLLNIPISFLYYYIFFQFHF